MSQQINLYDPALLRKRELLTAVNLAGVTLVLALALGGWGAWARTQLKTLEAESASVAPQLKTLKDQLAAMTKSLAGAKPDPGLEAELAQAQGLLALRGEMIAALKKSLGGESDAFAEYLRGLARQTPNGLWLTGFTVADGGAHMEIRGRMTDAALLSEYISRLNTEKAFKGRAFAALKIETPQSSTAGATAMPATPAAPAKPAAPGNFLEFRLVPISGAPKDKS